MSESSDRLEEEFAEITRCFADHPQISIVSTDGSPVNQYVIEYRVKGLVQLDDGEVVQSDQHRIELNLSFGFPHFPPNCKPLTKIFHPDMDPSAIKIAEFWGDSTSLSDLIRQIGKMICWQVFSSEDGFNQAALEWLKANESSVPMDTLQDVAQADSGAEVELSGDIPELSLDLSDGGAAENVDLDLGASEASESDTPPSFVDDLDFDFSKPKEENADISFDSADTTVAEENGGIEFSFEEPAAAELALEIDNPSETVPESPFVEEIDFNFEPSVSSDEVELNIADTGSGGDDAPLELRLENENIEPVEKESFSFVTAQEEDSVEDVTDIVVEQVAIEEPDLTPSFPVDDTEDVDLDLSVVDVDYDILKGMIEQRNYVAAQTKLSSMPAENISKAAAILQPTIEQCIEQAEGIHAQARNLEDEGLLEDAANKLEAVMNLVQDYPNLEADMKRVRDAWAGGSSSPAPDSNLGLERAVGTDLAPAQVRDTMLTETVVSPEDAPSVIKKKPQTQSTAKTKKSPSFLKQQKSLIFVVLGFIFAFGLSGWFFVEWQSFSKAEQKWGEINSLLENSEYQKAKEECLEIRTLLSRVKIIMGGGKKDLLVQVDDLLQSEHFLEGIEGKVLWQGQYISKRAFRAYDEINDLVEEAERQVALSKWQESADLYEKAFQIAQDNKTRLNEKFYDALSLDVKKVNFVNIVSLGKKYFDSSQWPQAIEKFEAALKLSRETGVTDSSKSFNVNRNLQRAWFSQYMIDGDKALRLDDFTTASEKFTKAHAIAKDPKLIDPKKRKQVLVKLNQSSLIKIMAEAERAVAEKQWPAAVKSYRQAKKYTMDGYPLIDMEVLKSQKKVEGHLVSATVGMEQEIASRKRGAQQYRAAKAAYGRIITTIDESSLRDQPAFQKIRRKAVAEKNAVYLKALVDDKVMYLKENYRRIVAANFTDVSIKALSNIKVEFLGQEEQALQFKIQCREQRESKYYTLELIYQYDIDLDLWGFPTR